MNSIANLLTQIKNAKAVQEAEVNVPFSKLNQAIDEALRGSGFLGSVEKKKKKAK